MVKRNQRGITLIALVITIIVLLILAGVTINILLGQDGIINRTQQAKEQHEYAAAKEIIDLKLVEIYTDAVSNNEEYTMSKITTGMTDDTTITIDEKYFNATASLKTGISDSIANLKGIVVSANQYERFKFLVSGVNGSIQVIGYTTETIPNTWTTGDLPTGFIAIGESKQATPPGTTTYTVTFKDGETTLSTATVEEGKTATKPTDPTKDGYEFVNWYSDSELTNLFEFTSTITENTIIYAKWEEVATVPMIIEKGQTTPRPITTADYGRNVRYNNQTYQIFFCDTEGKYGDEGRVYLQYKTYTASSGALNTHYPSTFEETGLGDTESLIYKLNPDWAKLVGTSLTNKTLSALNDNIKGVAYLTNTSEWNSTYVANEDISNGAFAIGGASVEMWCDSYNEARGKTSTDSDYFDAKAFSKNNTTGYWFKPNGNYGSGYYEGNYGSYTNTNSTYVISRDICEGMYRPAGSVLTYLASPSCTGANRTCLVYGETGTLTNLFVTNTYGVRPIVSLINGVILQEID